MRVNHSTSPDKFIVNNHYCIKIQNSQQTRISNQRLPRVLLKTYLHVSFHD